MSPPSEARMARLLRQTRRCGRTEADHMYKEGSKFFTYREQALGQGVRTLQDCNSRIPAL